MQQTTVEAGTGLLDDLRGAVADGDSGRAQALARVMLERDALALLEDLTAAELSRLFAILGDEVLAELLGRLDERDAARILLRMTTAQAADILEEIDPDDATDILAEIEPGLVEGLLVEMEPDEAAELRDLMVYPADSAGGIMTPAYVAVTPDLRADQAVVALRRVAAEAETVNYVYVCRPDTTLLGVLSLHALVLTPPASRVQDLMYADPVTVPVLADQEVAARLLTEYDLLAIPVVDDERRLLGIITADDVLDVIEEEATEDITRLGGASPLGAPYLRASPLSLFRSRIVWLVVLFVAQFFSVAVLEHFQGEMDRISILAVFTTIMIGTGGNVGSQTVSTVIRAIAVGEVALHDILRVVGKELGTGLMLGATMGVLMFARALFQGSADGVSPTSLGWTLAISVLILATWAATVAAVLPLVLTRLRVDPAVVSAPLITSLLDATGLFIYFTVAGMILLSGRSTRSPSGPPRPACRGSDADRYHARGMRWRPPRPTTGEGDRWWTWPARPRRRSRWRRRSASPRTARPSCRRPTG
jgi:magnesium transporter